jgi:molybdopterin converting factor small subunit
MAKSSKLQSGRASLCALGEYLRRLQFFAWLREQVKIPQKAVRQQPVDKLLYALMSMLCGAKTVAQSNLTVRVDAALQRAFGRKACAKQP